MAFFKKSLCTMMSALLITQSVGVSMAFATGNYEQQKVKICHISPDNPVESHEVDVSTHDLSTHLAHGDYMGECNDEGEPTSICYIPPHNPRSAKTIHVGKKKIGAFSNLGSYMGSCDDDKKVKICHVPPGNPQNAHTIEVSKNALSAHLRHGDTTGPCPRPTDEDPCDDDDDGVEMCCDAGTDYAKTKSICRGSVKKHLKKGNYLGKCIPTPKKVKICHVPPGNSGNAHTIWISENAVAAHLAHGDNYGDCTEVEARCGNGIVEEGEQCDDEAQSSYCNSDCTLSRCGDGKFNPAAGEYCDDGNESNNDACLNTCRVALCGDGYTRTGVEDCDTEGESASCNKNCSLARCGDEILNEKSGEQCDDGNNASGDGCSATCQREFACGNGIREGVEECDDGNQINTDDCLNNCTLPTCGDGYVHTDIEQCDDGNLDNTDGCLTSCALATCGDTFTHLTFEECDTGAYNNTGACTSGCKFGYCGDGYVLEDVEQCDDANRNNNDTCLNGCTFAVCGDGFTQDGIEECDDGNFHNYDACLPDCKIATCGDGFVHAGVEVCDDGANNGQEGRCLSDCSGIDYSKKESWWTTGRIIAVTLGSAAFAGLVGLVVYLAKKFGHHGHSYSGVAGGGAVQMGSGAAQSGADSL